MTATWLRVENDRPARFAAPTNAAPPALEGVDKLFESPLELRSMAVLAPHRACEAGVLHVAQEHVVHMFQFPNEEKMGTVRIACGGDALHADGAQALAAFALQALRCTTTKGAALLLDSCTTRTARAMCPDRHDGALLALNGNNIASTSTVSNAKRFLTRRGVSTIGGSSGPVLIGGTQRDDVQLLFWEQHKPNTHRFISHTSAVPLHPLLCIAEARPAIMPPGASHAAVIVGDSWLIGSVADSSGDQKAKKMITKYYATTYRRLLGVLRGVLLTAARCVAAAFPQDPRVSTVGAAVAAMVQGGADTPIAGFAVFTLGGLTLASRAFLAHATHWEKLIIAATAMDMLIPKANTFDTSADSDVASAVRVVEMPMRMVRLGGGDGSAGGPQPSIVDLVLVSVGSAMTMVFVVVPRPGTTVKGSALSSLLRDKLIVPSTVSHAYQRHCKRCMAECSVSSGAGNVHVATANSAASPAKRTAAERAATGDATDNVPLFPGLAGRGSGSMRVHVEAVTCAPTDVASGKLLDDMSTSDDEATGFELCGCVSSKAPAYGEHSNMRKVSMIEQDALDSLVLRYAARLKRIDDRAFGTIPAEGIRMYHALLTVGAPILIGGPRRAPLQRLQELKSSTFQSFEVSWWRHAAVGGCSTSAVGTVCANVVSATEHALQCVGTKIPWAAHITFSQLDIGTLFPSVQQQQSGPSGRSVVVVSHAQRALLAAEPCAVCTTTAAVHGHAPPQIGGSADCWDWTPELDAQGLNAPSGHRPVGMTRSQWKALRALHRLSISALEGALSLQHRSGALSVGR